MNDASRPEPGPKRSAVGALASTGSRGDGVRGAAGGSSPAISLPRGGGAIRGMGEKFSTNPVTGTGSLSVPVYASPERSGFGPQLSLTYDSGAGNGPFGWGLSVPSITRKTDRGLPRYRDAEESDVFILSRRSRLTTPQKRCPTKTGPSSQSTRATSWPDGPASSITRSPT